VGLGRIDWILRSFFITLNLRDSEIWLCIRREFFLSVCVVVVCGASVALGQNPVSLEPTDESGWYKQNEFITSQLVGVTEGTRG